MSLVLESLQLLSSLLIRSCICYLCLVLSEPRSQNRQQGYLTIYAERSVLLLLTTVIPKWQRRAPLYISSSPAVSALRTGKGMVASEQSLIVEVNFIVLDVNALATSSRSNMNTVHIRSELGQPNMQRPADHIVCPYLIPNTEQLLTHLAFAIVNATVLRVIACALGSVRSGRYGARWAK